jgi:transcription-repair coupling factor (superfamily II helicase)
VDRRHNLLNIKFHAETRVDPARLMNIVAKTRGAQFTPAGVLLLPLDGQASAREILAFLDARLEQMRPPG